MERFDVVIIGSGVVGAAIARELSRYRLAIAVLEKNLDVCNETSGRNTGVCHGGFAYDPGSLKARLCVKGNRAMDRLSRELGFKFERCGKVLVGNTEEEYERLKEVRKQGEANGVRGLELIDRDRLKSLVPCAEGEFALYSPDSGIIDPFMMNIAYAENACKNGVSFYFDNEVIGIRRDSNEYIISTNAGEYRSRWVINASGLGCGKISDMLGLTGYKIIGSKDDYVILDKRLGEKVTMPIYTVPSNTYMGTHVTRTTDGNVLLGPTAEDTEDLSYYGVKQSNIDYLVEESNKIWPYVNRADFIRTYSGILPKWVDDNGKIQDFKIEIKDIIAPNAVNLVGIESPGLTASYAIAEYVAELMQEREKFEINDQFDPIRKGITSFSEASITQQQRLIENDPDYGEIICRCNNITKAEIRQAINNPLGVHTMTGIKYRTRAMMGRCQGGYCQMRIAELIMEETGITDKELVYSGKGSHLLFGKLRDGCVKFSMKT